MILANKEEARELLISLGYRESGEKMIKNNNEDREVAVKFIETENANGTVVPIMTVDNPFTTPGGVCKTSTEFFTFPIETGEYHEGSGYFILQEEGSSWIDKNGEEQYICSSKNYCWI
ncbi:MAG: hypothetical protein WCP93_01195 [Candidatus Berkelbacteria bacterium]